LQASGGIIERKVIAELTGKRISRFDVLIGGTSAKSVDDPD
jgi:hypothetical protein